MTKKITLSFAISTILFTTASYAENINMQQLKQLFNTNQKQAAYDYSTKHLEEMEGDPYFDYLYGVAAIDTGNASQGVFALERVLLAFPEDHVARLELARGYFVLEEYARAREEFETVLEAKPPEGVVEITNNFLDQIRLKEARYRTTSNGYVEIAFGSDSNVNTGADETVVLFGFPITNSAGQDDTFSSFAASWQITHPFAPGWMVDAAITGSAKSHQDLTTYDTQIITLQTGITHIANKSKYKASILSQQYTLDSDKYRTLNGLNLDWNYAISQKSKFNTSLQYAQLDYPVYTDNNSDMLTLTAGYTRSFSIALAPLFISSLSFGSESAEDATNASSLADTERDILSARLGVVLNFSSKLALQTIFGYQSSEYAGEQTLAQFSGKIRDETLTSADVNLLWLFAKNWRLDTKFSYFDNVSNVDLYDYSRNVVSLNVNYAF